MPKVGDVLQSKRSTKEYVRQASILSYKHDGHVLYHMREIWLNKNGKPRKQHVKEWCYLTTPVFHQLYGGYDG
jgi:hypothetical protein